MSDVEAIGRQSVFVAVLVYEQVLDVLAFFLVSRGLCLLSVCRCPMLVSLFAALLAALLPALLAALLSALLAAGCSAGCSVDCSAGRSAGRSTGCSAGCSVGCSAVALCRLPC